MGITTIFIRDVKFLFALLSVLLAFPLWAQTPAEKQKLYLQGKSALEENNWTDAIRFFTLAEPGADQPFTPYLWYYKTAALLQTGNYPEAENYIQRLETAYKGHPIQKEVILQKLYLYKATQDVHAFIALDGSFELPDSLNDVFVSQRRYFFEAAPSDSLELWQKKYSNYRPLAVALASRYIIKSEESSQKRLEVLVKQFGIDKSTLPKNITTLRSAKQYRDVALILPISEPLMDTLRKTSTTPFLFEYYLGFMQAFEQDRTIKNTARFHVFTPGRSLDSLKALLEKPELMYMDLIVGPVLTQHSIMVAEYAEKHKIVMWNPINDHEDILESKSYVFAPQPQSRTIAKLVSRYVKQQTVAESAILFSGSTEKEQELGRLYAEQVKSDSLVLLKNWRWSQATAMEWYDSLQVIGMDSLKHIFAPISTPTTAAALMSVLERIPSMVEIYTGPEWLDNSLMSFGQFERRHFKFYYPDLVNYDHPSALRFRTYYLRSMGVVPSIYAYKGYEHGLILFKLMSTVKIGLKDYMKKHFIKGEIMSGCDFRISNDNSYVPLIKFQDRSVVIINPPVLGN